MSSEKGVRIPLVDSRRFPGEGLSPQGQSGPKPRPMGVGDGQQVKIPVLGAKEKRCADAQGEGNPADGRAGPSERAARGVKRPRQGKP